MLLEALEACRFQPEGGALPTEHRGMKLRSAAERVGSSIFCKLVLKGLFPDQYRGLNDCHDII